MIKRTKLENSVPEKELHETVAGTTQSHWMEEILNNATKKGDFDALPGKGRPLNLHDSDPYAGPEAEGYRVLKNAGFTPEWVTLRTKIAEEIAWLRANPQNPERVSRIVEVNILIDKHNREIPNPSLCFPKIPRNFGQE